jgi:hypothetical protein
VLQANVISGFLRFPKESISANEKFSKGIPYVLKIYRPMVNTSTIRGDLWFLFGLLMKINQPFDGRTKCQLATAASMWQHDKACLSTLSGYHRLIQWVSGKLAVFSADASLLEPDEY